MSRRYTADGRRISSMTHARQPHPCSCGRTVFGNGGSTSHRRACDGYFLTWTQWGARRAVIADTGSVDDE